MSFPPGIPPLQSADGQGSSHAFLRNLSRLELQDRCLAQGMPAKRWTREECLEQLRLSGDPAAEDGVGDVFRLTQTQDGDSQAPVRDMNALPTGDAKAAAYEKALRECVRNRIGQAKKTLPALLKDLCEEHGLEEHVLSRLLALFEGSCRRWEDVPRKSVKRYYNGDLVPMSLSDLHDARVALATAAAAGTEAREYMERCSEGLPGRLRGMDMYENSVSLSGSEGSAADGGKARGASAGGSDPREETSQLASGDDSQAAGGGGPAASAACCGKSDFEPNIGKENEGFMNKSRKGGGRRDAGSSNSRDGSDESAASSGAASQSDASSSSSHPESESRSTSSLDGSVSLRSEDSRRSSDEEEDDDEAVSSAVPEEGGDDEDGGDAGHVPPAGRPDGMLEGEAPEATPDFREALKTLPGGLVAPPEFLDRLAEDVRGLADMMASVPGELGLADGVDFVESVVRNEGGFEAAVASGCGCKAPVVLPSHGVAYQAQHRVESLLWLHESRVGVSDMGGTRAELARLRAEVVGRCGIEMSCFTGRMLVSVYGGVEGMAEDEGELADVAELLGAARRRALLRALHAHQVDALAGVMKQQSKGVAGELVGAARTARRAVCLPSRAVEDAFADRRAAHAALRALHGAGWPPAHALDTTRYDGAELGRDAARLLGYITAATTRPHWWAGLLNDEYASLAAAQAAPLHDVLCAGTRGAAGDTPAAAVRVYAALHADGRSKGCPRSARAARETLRLYAAARRHARLANPARATAAVMKGFGSVARAQAAGAACLGPAGPDDEVAAMCDALAVAMRAA